MLPLSIALLLLYCWAVSAGKDYYKILSVAKTASTADIKRAYRKLSLKYHPDKNSSPDAAEHFAEIAAAYDVLSDSDKRAAYDRGGEEAVKQQEQRANTPQADPFDIFSHFGFGGMGGGHFRQEDPRTPNVEIPVRVTLRDLYLGEMLDVEYNRQVLCVEASSCEKKSQECQGPGIKVRMQQLAPGFVQQVQVSDPTCVARGKAWKSPCKACPRGMTEEEEIQLTVDIQPGMHDGDRIKFDQVADEAVGHIPGDLVFVIKQAPDAVFRREGDDLHIQIVVTLLQALVGFEKSVYHLDGREVVIRKNDVTYCGEVVRMVGQGMPKKGTGRKSFGDLYVTLQVDFPRSFSDKQKKLISEAMTMKA